MIVVTSETGKTNLNDRTGQKMEGKCELIKYIYLLVSVVFQLGYFQIKLVCSLVDTRPCFCISIHNHQSAKWNSIDV